MKPVGNIELWMNIKTERIGKQRTCCIFECSGFWANLGSVMLISHLAFFKWNASPFLCPRFSISAVIPEVGQAKSVFIIEDFIKRKKKKNQQFYIRTREISKPLSHSVFGFVQPQKGCCQLPQCISRQKIPHLPFLWAFCVVPFQPRYSITLLSSRSFCWRLQDPFCLLALVHWGDSTMCWTSPLHPQLRWGSQQIPLPHPRWPQSWGLLVHVDPSEMLPQSPQHHGKDTYFLNPYDVQIFVWLLKLSQPSQVLSLPHYPFPSPYLKYFCKRSSASGPNTIHQAASREASWKETCFKDWGQ